jgi:hypothetical protein
MPPSQILQRHLPQRFQSLFGSRGAPELAIERAIVLVHLAEARRSLPAPRSIIHA